jgi:carbonic anhydrase/acetyltransferase-like protein (isoleucine patch superfamily)
MAQTFPHSSLAAFTEFMNPRGIDLTPYCPRILPAVANNPRNPEGVLRLSMPDIDSGAIVLGNGTLIQGDVTIGKGSSVFEGVYIRADKGPEVIIGQNCDIQDGVTIHVSATRRTNTIIGNGATLAHRGVCHGAIIGENAFIALNAILNDGCEIGKGTFVDSGSVIDAEAILQDGKQYKGHVPAFYRNPKYSAAQEADPLAVGDTKDIIVAARDGSTHPLGEIDGRYAKSQALGANTRRWIQAGELGDFDVLQNAARPAMAYVEAAQMQQGKLYLEQAGMLLASVFHNGGQHAHLAGVDRQDILLAQHALHLADAINHVYTGSSPPPEVQAAWAKKKDILAQLEERLLQVGNTLHETSASLPISTALRKPVLIDAEDTIKAARKIQTFAEEAQRIENQIEPGIPSPRLRANARNALGGIPTLPPEVQGGDTVASPDSPITKTRTPSHRTPG